MDKLFTRVNVMNWLSFGERTEQMGALRVDIRPGVADEIADIRKLPYVNNSFDGVECYHVLEHLILTEAAVAAGELWRVLKPGGVLKMAVQDMLKCAETLLSGNVQVMWNIYSPSPEAALRHRWGYTFETLKELLSDAQFRNITRVASHPADPHEIRIKAIK